MNLSKIFPSRHDKGGTAELFAIAFPMIISTACDGVMTFTDRLMLSRISPEQMNAAMGGGVTMQLMIFFFIGLTGYTTALVAQYFGAKQKNMTGVVAFQSFMISIIAYPIILLCRPLANIYFDFMDLPSGQLSYQSEYFNIVIFGTISGILRNSIGCYFSGIGRTRIVMVANISAMVINLILDYLFIFGKAGFPRMEISGAAYATVIGSVCGLIILIIAYLGKKNREEFNIAHSFHFNPAVMRKLLYFGYPAGLEFFLNFFAFTTLTFIFHAQGTIVATASTIMFNWDLVSFIPLLGIEIAVTSLVGRYMGAGDPNTAHRAAMSGIKTGFYYSAVILILFLLIPEALVRMFRPNVTMEIFNEAVPIAVNMVKLASLYVLLEAVLVAIIGALRGAGDTHVTMVLTVSAHWTMLLVVYILLNTLKTSAEVAWLGLIVTFLVFCGVVIVRYRKGKWREIKVVGNK